jgi:glycosyltransferase involved in cell wall biosynthesis
MRIAMVGTRGIPAQYGGFETAVEEIGTRLVTRGHEVVVYCRGTGGPSYRGMKRVERAAFRHKATETLSHTALSTAHLVRHRPDVAIVFNAANAPLLPVIRGAKVPVAVHVDGLEWQRAKWGPVGRRYYLANERLAVRWANALIADAIGIQDYYLEKYGAKSTFIPYGAPVVMASDPVSLRERGLSERGYHLVVARLEPENHVDVILRGYLASDARLPLIVVGSVPYASDHEATIQELASTDSRVRLLGSVWDQHVLDSLYAGAASYIHGHSVGGTNPSLLRAMGAGAASTAYDVHFNREVLGTSGRYFTTPAELAELINAVEAAPEAARLRGAEAQTAAQTRYRWDQVALDYEDLCLNILDSHGPRAERPLDQRS